MKGILAEHLCIIMRVTGVTTGPNTTRPAPQSAPIPRTQPLSRCKLLPRIGRPAFQESLASLSMNLVFPSLNQLWPSWLAVELH